MRRAFRVRLRIILGLVLLIGFAIVVRLYIVQIMHGADYALKADRQYASAGGSLFDRGSIYFTRKDGTLISAATLETGFLVAINPQTIEDPLAAYAAIDKAAGGAIMARDSFDTAATNSKAVYVEVAHHLTEAAGEALAAQKIKGVQVLRERWRVYPGGNLAAQTIGFVAQSASDSELLGRTGLEAKYQDVLSRDGSGLYKNFFAELFSDIGDVLVDARQTREGDIITTIEPEVETRLVQDLAKVNAKYSSKETGGIIMDPATGAIYALATYPTYDSNNFGDASLSTLGNPLVEHVYEFGSIMKALTMASGLDAGVITPSSTYNDTGCITVDTATICNYDLKARGVVPMQEILSQSLNLGAAWVAGKLGPDLMRHYFTALGFGTKTGIDLPSETHGLINNLNSPREVEYDTAAFGQGVAVTPVEMIRALAALAAGGAIPVPHVVSGVRLDSGLTREISWASSTPVFKAESAREVSTMHTKLSNGTAKIPTMSVAAKTGTAQLTNGTGGYYKDRYFHSFFGYFPSYNPRFIILLYTNDPQGVEYASETLTSTYMDLVHFLIDYYDVPPDRGVAPATNP